MEQFFILWVPCQYGMGHLQIVEAQDGYRVLTVDAIILKN